jgi:hypothetical protein
MGVVLGAAVAAGRGRTGPGRPPAAGSDEEKGAKNPPRAKWRVSHS